MKDLNKKLQLKAVDTISLANTKQELDLCPEMESKMKLINDKEKSIEELARIYERSDVHLRKAIVLIIMAVGQ
jgi:glutamate mutase epsilon subunit